MGKRRERRKKEATQEGESKRQTVKEEEGDEKQEDTGEQWGARSVIRHRQHKKTPDVRARGDQQSVGKEVESWRGVHMSPAQLPWRQGCPPPPHQQISPVAVVVVLVVAA